MRVLWSTFAPEPGQKRMWFKHNVVRCGKGFIEVAVEPDGIADDWTDRLNRRRIKFYGYDVVLVEGADPHIYFTSAKRRELETTGGCPESYGEPPWVPNLPDQG